jgi:subtilisin family serine protease
VPLPEVVYAQASPTSMGGTSLFATGARIRAANVPSFFASAGVVRAAERALKRAGFKVLNVAPTTINIAGPPDLYESVFQTELFTEEREVVKLLGTPDTATFVETRDTDMPGLIDTSNSPVANVVEGVAIERPVYYMAPNAYPPPKAYWHLRVPGDVSMGLGADAVHRRMGLTGKGVNVVMVDSGWFAHPYFVGRGYRASVGLGPGAMNINLDGSGHGTGESANLYALAPDIEFTMMKMSFFNSTAAFNAAVALQPDIISVSWGTDVEKPPLGAADRALAASVAAAVESGIIVVAASGNGQFSFPGQHPDVISAGGVYMEEDGALQASSYASGFPSKIFSRRNIPDVSGLVGMAPNGTYIALPVEPSSEMDTVFGGGAHPAKDETKTDDGWAMFSGTSAAAPQLAGICALMKEANPNLTPKDARDILKRTARDVKKGKNAMGHRAKAGRDVATGAGLADAQKAVQAAARRR